MRFINKVLYAEDNCSLCFKNDCGAETIDGIYCPVSTMKSCMPASYINTVEKAKEYFIEIKDKNIEKYQEECRKHFYELKEQEEEE